MADKIKKFFQKKKIDAKFKLAGPGHKLSESTFSQSSNISNISRNVPVVKRSGLSEESKVAAEAALSRLQQTRENPAFNTSLAAIKVFYHNIFNVFFVSRGNQMSSNQNRFYKLLHVEF